MTRVTDAQLASLHANGFVVIPDFVSGETLERAQAAISTDFPTAEEAFADPDAHPWIFESQFSGIKLFPWAAFDVNRLVVDEDLIDLAERALDTDEVRIYKGEFWAKYAGATNYDQALHRDFGNHTLVVPRADQRWRQLTTFLFLSDVGPDSGAPGIVPRDRSADIPLGQRRLPRDHPLHEQEQLACGPAGTLVAYFTDVFHRGRDLTEPGAARFMVLADFKSADMDWGGRHAWPDRANHDEWHEFVSNITPRQRALFGFPLPGHDYWNAQTVADVGLRYPNMNMEPYRVSP